MDSSPHSVLPPERSARAGATVRRAVDELRPAFLQALAAALPRALRAGVSELDRDASRERASRAARVLLRDESALVADFLAALDRELDRACDALCGEPAAAAPRPAARRSLSLVGLDEVEEGMVVDRMGARLRNVADETYTHFHQRAANLLRVPRLGDRDNPFHPLRAATALVSAIEARGLEAEDRVEVLKAVEQQLGAPLRQLYADLDAELEARGVSDLADATLLRNTANGVRRLLHEQGAGEAATTRAPAQAPRGRSAHAEELLLALYQHMRVSGQAPAGPATPAGGAPAPLPGGAPRLPFGQVEPLRAPTPPLAPGLVFEDLSRADGNLLGALADSQRRAAEATMAAAQTGGRPVPAVVMAHDAAARAALIERATRQIDKLTIELVGLLFERIHEDRYLAEAVRAVLVRLQLPFLRAALTDPGLFVSAETPARRLLDRVSSTSLGWTPEGADNARYLDEVQRSVDMVVLAVEEQGGAVFERALASFERYLAEERGRDDDPVQRARRALEEIEAREVMVINATIGVRRAFEGVLLEGYLREFLLVHWVRVLVSATLRERSEPGYEQRYKEAVPELVWSVQPKLNPEDRRKLVTLIPRVLAALRDGLALIEWPQPQVAEFFARLMASHANALKALELAHGIEPPVVDTTALRERLAQVRIALPPEGVDLGEINLDPEAVRRMAERGNLPLQVAEPLADTVDPALPAARLGDHELDALVETWNRGDWFALRVAEREERARLRWISPRRSFYLFAAAESGAAHSLSPETVRNFLRLGRLRPLEPAPLFDRAVGSVVQDLADGPAS
jgi:hypothetical protein